MRNIRGVKALVEYLTSVNCFIGETTIYKLVQKNEIPYNRISSRVLIFNLDRIDEWLQKEEANHAQ